MNLRSLFENPLVIRALIVLPPIAFVVYVTHSLIVIRSLMSASTEFHLDYADSLVQEFLDLEISLEAEHLLLCISRNDGQPLDDAQIEACGGKGWLNFETTGTAIRSLALKDGSQQAFYLARAGLEARFEGFFSERKGLAGLFARRYHEPVYWCRILAPNDDELYKSSETPASLERGKIYPLRALSEGYRVQIVYNSFGPKQLYSVAKNRINFGLILLLFTLFLLSMVLATRLIRQKLLLARQKTFFATTVSHEFKTPLAVMKLASETLMSGRYKSEQEANRFHRMIQNEINRLAHLVHKILNFNKIESGQVAYHARTIDLRELVEGGLDVFAIRAEAEGVELEEDICAKPCPVNIDPELVRHAFDNVLDNATFYYIYIR